MRRSNNSFPSLLPYFSPFIFSYKLSKKKKDFKKNVPNVEDLEKTSS